MEKPAATRIGLVLASIHTGSALNVWPSFAREAAAEGISLFIFPGGQLNMPADLEYLRNPIFSLVNPRNLDGLISWSSTIGLNVSPEEFSMFHAAFDPLPYLTIAHKAPGHPCVQFDAYNGMKNLTAAFITRYQARRIAFLRGPLFHESALDRFNGYRDALKEAGLPWDERLASDPANWTNGAAACAQLVETRGLIPARDFDTLIGSSDMMTLPAVQYLLKKGYSEPEDYRAGGFNNSIESKILASPFSTVRIPYADLSGKSFEILKRLLAEKDDPSGLIRDELLPCEVIIRPISRNAAPPFYKTIDTSVPAHLLSAAGEEPREQFLNRFQDFLSCFLDAGRDIDDVLKIVSLLAARRRSAGPEEAAQGARRPIDVEQELYRIIVRQQERSYAYSQYRREKWHTALNSLKCELLGTRDRKSLIESLARHLPKIGVFTASVMLYENENVSECAGNFSSAGIDARGKRWFPADRLYPEELADQYGGAGVFMVQPLFIENRSLGYFIHNVPFYDGVILEELRSTISNAFKGIFLFEETNRAKQSAQRDERAKTEFFIAIGSNLHDPFIEVIDAIEDLENSIAGAGPALSLPDSAAERISRAKSAAVFRQAQTNRLLDLTLSQIDEFAFSKTLFNIERLLPELSSQGPFPLLAGDTSRLSDAFTLIREVYGSDVSVLPSYRGLKITFTGRALQAEPKAQEGFIRYAVLLAERIILIHNGEMNRRDSCCQVTLPWITYTGRNPVRKAPAKDSCVLSLGPDAAGGRDAFPAAEREFPGLPLIRNLEKALSISGRVAFILWNAGDAGHEDFVNLSALRSLAGFLHTPFLCFGGDLTGETLSAAVDSRIQRGKARTLLFIGLDEGCFPAWRDQDTAVRLAAAGDFADAVAREPPGLVVLGTVDFETLNAVRSHPATVAVPVIIAPEHIRSPEEVAELCHYPRVILCNRGVASSREFSRRVRAVAAGGAILPPYTGALVKKVLLYCNLHAESHISRWKLADSVNVSEDYLSRIFRREMGFSLWEYLNRYRVHLAAELLTHTGDAICDIAMRTGFQDHAYFCRVFKNIYGKAPGQLRNNRP
ncbi:MAG: helix-turn-helix domain-containing protein [Spirochaetaceae bacterium]|jgi:DNA-binding LacI/PurR family transcriptional regulator/AraC-like DNA-binding protein|nr:helix-turn-helix domain-containing protein [Spirochaetaceae bacterium]